MSHQSHHLWRVALSCACVLGAAQNRLTAQGAPPPTPDVTPITGAPTPQYLQLIDRTPPPAVLAGPTYRLLLASAATAAALDTVDAFRELARACPKESAGLSAPAAGYSSSVSIDSSQYFVLIGLNDPAPAGACEAVWNATAPAIWRATSFGGSRLDEGSVPRALRLIVDGVTVEPVRTVARPALEWRIDAWVRVPSQLRYYYPMSVLTPAANGSARIGVQVWDVRGIATFHDVPRHEVERLQYGYAVWRLATSARHARAVQLSPTHPVSPDVQRALDLAKRGDTDEGARRAAESLAFVPLTKQTEYSRDVAVMLVAEALTQHQDSAAARGFIRGVRSRRSCLSPLPGASPSVTQSIAAVRRDLCSSQNPMMVLGAGIIIPTGGHLAQRRPMYAAIAAAALSGFFVNAYSLESSARDSYASYEASRDPRETQLLFKQAESLRSSARSRATLGLAVWGADAVVASVITFIQNRAVARGRL